MRGEWRVDNVELRHMASLPFLKARHPSRSLLFSDLQFLSPLYQSIFTNTPICQLSSLMERCPSFTNLEPDRAT